MPGLEKGKAFQESFSLQKGKIDRPGLCLNSKELHSHCFSGRQQISNGHLSTELVLQMQTM